MRIIDILAAIIAFAALLLIASLITQHSQALHSVALSQALYSAAAR